MSEFDEDAGDRVRPSREQRSEYPSNSKTGGSKRRSAERPSKDKPVKKKVEEPIIEGTVSRRKKPLHRRVLDSFIGDNVESVWRYVVDDVLIPAAKSAVTDAVGEGIERLVFGDSRRSRRSSSSGSRVYTSYDRYSDSPSRSREPHREMSRTARARHDFDEILINNRGEAEEVLDRLYLLLEEYDVVTVNDLYDLVGIEGTFQDDKWGWTDLTGSEVRRVRDGYLLDLPRTKMID